MITMENASIIEESLRNIDKRNERTINLILEEKREFNERINKVVRKARLRNKIDKIKAGAKLTISKEEIEMVNNLTKITKEKLLQKAMKMSNGDEEKAISLLFDPSSSIEI